MTVQRILETKGRDIVSVKADETLEAVVQVLAQRRIGAVIVTGGQGIDGILSERDVVRVLGERGASVLKERVGDVMTTKVVSCKPTDTVAELMERMTSGKFRHLPVVDDGRVIGIVSIGDVVKQRVDEYESEQEAMRDYIKTA